MWQGGKFRIRDHRGKLYEVLGISDEVFGISQVGISEIAVTHIASGKRISSPFGNIGQAMRFADEIRPLGDWSSLDPPVGIAGRVMGIREDILRTLRV